MIPWWEVLLRLVLAIALGGVVGYQRETTERPAGFRTHVLVALGSALFTLVSFYPFDGVGKIGTDPTRIAAQIVTGIGFLGAGTIIRRENLVIGLTTAASLWAVAAVGIAVGVGYYAAGLAGSFLIFAVLSVFKWLELRFMPAVGERTVVLIVRGWPEVIGRIQERLTELNVSIKSSSMKRLGGDRTEVVLDLESLAFIDEALLLGEIGKIGGVEEVHIKPPGMSGDGLL